MSDERSMEMLLRWRAFRAAAEAPAPPSARELLQRARPWWEAWPDRLGARVERLTRMQVTYGVAQSETRTAQTGHPVPTIVMQDTLEFDAFSRVLYFAVQRGKLRLRLQLEGGAGARAQDAELTFVAMHSPEVLFSAWAAASPGGEYSLDADLPEALSIAWQGVLVTDRMPFRLIVGFAGAATPDA